MIAALLSWGYIAAYLRGGPRIIDATSYFLEGRALSEGLVSWPVGEPESSVLGRFLVRSEDAAGARAAVLFPPGYPALLAVGFLVGAPLAVGPLLAAALVIATYLLAREVVLAGAGARHAAGLGAVAARGAMDARLAKVPLVAAGLSVVCAALRYHTAETMSHGLAALCFAMGTVCLMRACRARYPRRGVPGQRQGRAPTPPHSAGKQAGTTARDEVGDAVPRSSEPAIANGEVGDAARRSFGWAALAGLFGGWLFATRPASGLAWFALVAAVLVVRVLCARGVDERGVDERGVDERGADARASGGRAVDEPSQDRSVARGGSLRATWGEGLGEALRVGVAVVVGAAPLAILFLLHQRLVTGEWLVTAHAAHYATNDGPAGCFRYGFGEGIGCFGEHGDFVRANLPDGFGVVAAAKTTARRLWMHLSDAGNSELLALLVPVGAWLGWRVPRVKWLVAAIAVQVAAYVPFYFDGNYPGGGARLFADVLPFEHVLLALAAALLASRTRGSTQPEPDGASARSLASRTKGSTQPEPQGLAPTSRASAGSLASRAPPGHSPTSLAPAAWIVALALIGFALRAGFDHAQLRDRDGGAPLFDARDEQQLRRSLPGAPSGPAMLFVETDAAFDLAFDPAARARGGVEVARWKGDAIDTLAWLSRGAPPAFVARFEVPANGGRGRTVIEPYPLRAEEPLVLEGESLWPPRAQRGGAYVLPIFASGTCASRGRALRLFAGSDRDGAVQVGLPAEHVRGRSLEVTLITAEASDGAEASGASRATSGRSLACPGCASVTVAVVADGEEIVRASTIVGALACPVAVRARVPAGARRVDVVLAPEWEKRLDPEREPLVALDRIAASSSER